MTNEQYILESALANLSSWAPDVKNRIECIYKENTHIIFTIYYLFLITLYYTHFYLKCYIFS